MSITLVDNVYYFIVFKASTFNFASMSYHIEAETKLMPFRRGHFQMHFLEWKCLKPIKISLKFVPRGPINNIPALVQIMAWCQPSDKPLSESMMVSVPTYVCVTRPQWIKEHFHFAFLVKINNAIPTMLQYCYMSIHLVDTMYSFIVFKISTFYFPNGS